MEELSEQISILLPLFSSLISSIVVFIATHLFYQSKLRKENKAVGAKLISDQIMESLVSVRKFANQLRVYENISVTTPEPDTDYEINPDRLNYQPIFNTEEDLFEFQDQLSELAATHQNNLDYKESIGQSEGDSPSVVHLEPLIDKDAISDVKQNNIYRKITIKGADYHELANEDLTSDMLSTSIKALDEVNGVNFEISVTMAREARNKSLDQSEVRKIIDDVLILKEKDLDVSMNIATKKDENNAIEYIDLLTPRLTSSIVVEVENRSTIGAEYIFESFKDQNYYNEEVHMQSILRSILYQN